MNTTAEIILAIVIAAFGSTGFWTALNRWTDRKSAQGKLIQGIAYSQIINLCETYIDRGSLTTNEFHELEHYLYQPYAAMGGNGTAEKLFNDVKGLPVREEKE